jgi:putative addiction module component (TIGR02574 family)
MLHSLVVVLYERWRSGTMTRDAADLLTDALSLPDEERARLVRALIDSLEAEDQDRTASPTELEAAWRAEIESREQEIERDSTRLVPAEQVFAEAERRLLEIRATREQHRRSG